MSVLADDEHGGARNAYKEGVNYWRWSSCEKSGPRTGYKTNTGDEEKRVKACTRSDAVSGWDSKRPGDK